MALTAAEKQKAYRERIRKQEDQPLTLERDSGEAEQTLQTDAELIESVEAVTVPAPEQDARAELEAEQREEALAFGRRLGEHEADSRGEEGEVREARIQRAVDYAAWDFDGRESAPGAPVYHGEDLKSITEKKK